jgi:hypothetical protein
MSTPRSVEEIANAAGVLLGEVPPVIAVLATDTSKCGKMIFERLPDLRKQFLRRHHWNFAVDRKRLKPTYKVVTNAVDAAGLIRLTIAAHGWATGDRITSEEVGGVEGANGTYYITVVDPNTVELDDSTFAGAYTAGGKATLAPQFDYAYQIALPSDFIKLVQVADESEYKLEGTNILANVSTIYIRYVKDTVTYDKWDALAYKCFHYFVAIELCETITSSSEKKQLLVDELTKIYLPNAKNTDATEDPHTKTSESWLDDLRMGGSHRGFVRDPMT